MADTPETRFIAAINRKITKLAPNIKHIKFALRFNNGWPDSGYFALGGRLLWVEYKVHPNKPTPQQRQTITQLRALGQKVAILTQHDTYTIIEPDETSPPFTDQTPHNWIIQTLQ